MCGRARCSLDPRYYHKCVCDKLKSKLNWKNESEYKPKYNASPNHILPVVTYNSYTNTFQIESKKWGFDSKFISTPLINCRYETYEEKFKWKKKGVLYINGFYEWNKKKQAFYIHPATKKKKSEEEETTAPLFCVGVLYDSKSFSILTTEPRDAEYAKIHNRIPLILSNPIQWILGEEKPSLGGQEIGFYRVSDYVNKVGNESEKCIKPFKSPLARFFKKKKSPTKKKKKKDKDKKRKRGEDVNSVQIDDENESPLKKRKLD